MAAMLENIYQKFNRECLWLNWVFNSDTATGGQADFFRNQITKEMCVIRLHDAWSRFCRELILSSAGSKAKIGGGIRLPRSPGVNKYSDVIPVLLSTYKKRSKEPAWHSPSECLDAAARLKISNYPTVQTGLQLSFNGPAPIAQLTAVRNYIAHRNRNTAQGIAKVAQGLFISPVPRAFELASAIIPSGITLFSLWIIRLGTMAQLSIQ